MTREQIVTAIRRLDPAEQERIADEIWLGLDATTREDVEQAWQAEVESRIDARSSGTSVPLDGEQVFEQLDEELERRRTQRPCDSQ